jgi:hypothetical protein
MRYQVSVILHAPADQIAGQLRPGEGQVEPLDPDRCLLRTQGDSLDWLAFMLVWLNVGFEISEPPELVDYVTELSSRLAHSVAWSSQP